MKFGRGTTTATGNPDADERIVKGGFWPKIRGAAAGLPFAEDAVAAHYCAFDRETPNSVRLTLIGALAYFVMPVDLVPDVMPILGFTDDAGVLSAAIMAVGSHMDERHRAAARAMLDRLKTGKKA